MFDLFKQSQPQEPVEQQTFQCPHCGSECTVEMQEQRRDGHDVSQGTWRDIPAAWHTLTHDTTWSDVWSDLFK